MKCCCVCGGERERESEEKFINAGLVGLFYVMQMLGFKSIETYFFFSIDRLLLFPFLIPTLIFGFGLH